MMSKFYTNIEISGNDILYRGYQDGVPVQQKIPYKPHLFVDTTKETPYRVFRSNRPVDKIEFDTVANLKEYVKAYDDVHGMNHYGCSNMVRQFTGNAFRGEINWEYSQTKIWFWDIETRVGENSQGFPHPDRADEEILLITMMEHFSQKIYVWSTKSIPADNKIFTELKNVTFKAFDTEKAMLKDFAFFFAATRIDVLSGWNSEFFDMPYTINRIKKVLNDNVVRGLSPWRIVKPKTVQLDNGESKNTYSIVGITHLDYLELYKKFNPGSKESFKLDYIADYELGERKVDLLGESFKESYSGTFDIKNVTDQSSDLEKKSNLRMLIRDELKNRASQPAVMFVDIPTPQLTKRYEELDAEVKTLAFGEFTYYNCIDTILLHKLENKMLLVRLAMQLAFIAKCQFGDVVSSMRLWESIIYNYFLDIDIVEEYEKPKNDKHSIVGAYVHEPVPGKYGWTISLDFTSLYPSIMMQNNISPETIVDMVDVTIDGILNDQHIGKVQDGCIVSANGLVTDRDKDGFIPILVKRMFDLRKQTKRKMLDLEKERQAVKNRLAELGASVD